MKEDRGDYFSLIRKLIETNIDDFAYLFEYLPVPFAYNKIVYDEQGIAMDVQRLYANTAFKELSFLNEETLVGKTIADVHPKFHLDYPDLIEKVKNLNRHRYITFDRYFQDQNVWFAFIWIATSSDTYFSSIQDITISSMANKKLELNNVFLSICAICKLIKDENGDYITLDKYLDVHSQVKFSHGYCPKCYENIMKMMGR